MNKKYLALVLAKKKSFRLKNKNILKLGKFPLIIHSFKQIVKINSLFVDVVVSTDSLEIKKHTLRYGFKYLKRPKNLSTKNSTSESGAIHAANYYKKKFGNFDYIVLFQPTSPFRTKKTILRAINLSRRYPTKQIVSVNKANKKKTPNGLIYITPIKKLLKYNKFSYKNFFPLIISSKKESLDLDTIEDFKLAQKYV